MPVDLLDPATAAELQRQPLTYAAVGATAAGPPPPGFRAFTKTRALRRRDFDQATQDLMSWQVQSRVGLKVACSSVPLQVDSVAVMRLGVGRASVRIPCRVVYVIDEPDRRGFAYGTLPGHPESGEEAFVIQRRDDGQIDFLISAFSKPATRLAKVGGPTTTAIQRLMTNRYLKALDD